MGRSILIWPSFTQLCRSQTVQLLSRHWIVRNDENDVVAEVAKGSRGVVGCTPILKPATCFSYYSGTDLETKGCMEGSFELAVLNAKGLPESSFEARIAPFRFLMPEHTDLESS